MTLIQNYYEFLGVESSADTATLRRAFHKRSKAFHPDTTSLPVREAAEKFQLLCEAYDLLVDPKRRKIYDQKLTRKNIRKGISKDISFDNDYSTDTSSQRVNVLRPLSGGELFSLVLLALTIIICLFLCLTLAYMKGAELQFQPSWLIAVCLNPCLVKGYYFSIT